MDYLSFQYTVNTRSRQLSHKNEALRRIAQVCKTWHSAAVVPLYRNLQISRPESIPLLLRTLKTSKYLQNVIQNLSYIPPKSWRLKYVGKPVKDQHDKLCQICAILPNAVTLHLKLVVQASVPLLTGNANNISSLHMVTIGGILSSHDMTNLSFPVLETLTLEFSHWYRDCTQFWLDAPQLATLRLLNSSISQIDCGPSWLQWAVTKVRHLELHNIRTTPNDHSFCTLLKQCSERLESIILNPRELNPNPEGVLDFTQFVALKHVTLCGFPNDNNYLRNKFQTTVVLPHGLEHLVIWEARSESRSDTLSEEMWFPFSSECIQRVFAILWSLGMHHTPLLETVTLFGWEEIWADEVNRALIEKLCNDLGVKIRVELWKLVPQPQPSKRCCTARSSA